MKQYANLDKISNYTATSTLYYSETLAYILEHTNASQLLVFFHTTSIETGNNPWKPKIATSHTSHELFLFSFSFSPGKDHVFSRVTTTPDANRRSDRQISFTFFFAGEEGRGDCNTEKYWDPEEGCATPIV